MPVPSEVTTTTMRSRLLHFASVGALKLPKVASYVRAEFDAAPPIPNCLGVERHPEVVRTGQNIAPTASELRAKCDSRRKLGAS